MKKSLLGLVLLTMLFFVACEPEEEVIPDPCEKDNFGFLVVTNASTTTSFDLWAIDTGGNPEYKDDLAPGASSNLLSMDSGDYTLEARETNADTVLWSDSLTIQRCVESTMSLGQ